MMEHTCAMYIDEVTQSQQRSCGGDYVEGGLAVDGRLGFEGVDVFEEFVQMAMATVVGYVAENTLTKSDRW